MTRKEYTFDAGYQPQVRAPRGTSNIMLDVIIALIPAICVGVWQFGFKALIPVCTSVLSCVFFSSSGLTASSCTSTPRSAISPPSSRVCSLP